jgi:hypothetical protein
MSYVLYKPLCELHELRALIFFSLYFLMELEIGIISLKASKDYRAGLLAD